MTHLEFSPYHNRHIKFTLANGETSHGVILDIISYEDKEYDTEYIFIPTNKMMDWSNADKEKNKEKKEQLQSKIDISQIISAELIS